MIAKQLGIATPRPTMVHKRSIPIQQFAISHSEGMLRRAQFFRFGPEQSDDIEGTTISQNFINSCTLLNAIMHLAQTSDGRQQIHNMVSENEDGTYDVRFPGQAANEPAIKVKGLTEGEKMLACESGRDDIYLALLEKAMGQYCNGKVFWPWEHGAQVRADGLTLAMNGHAGLNYRIPVQLMTGHSVSEINTKNFFTSTPDPDAVSRRATEAFNKNAVVLFGIKIPPGPGHLLYEDFRHHPNHAYLMTDCTADGATIRNPIQGQPREKFYTWAQLADVMSAVVIEDRP